MAVYAIFHSTITDQDKMNAYMEQVMATVPAEGVRALAIDDNTRTLEGNTDGDVGLHALVDAILGALGCGDLGQHFPVDDVTWHGRPSGDLVRVARDLMTERHATLLHADITLLCQRPHLAPHQEAMRRNVADLLGVGEPRVNIKVTSTDGLGFLGRCEDIAAAATVTIRRPLS